MTLTWFGWIFVALCAINALVSISSIGKTRQPMSPAAAIGVLVMNSLLIWGAVSVGVAR